MNVGSPKRMEAAPLPLAREAQSPRGAEDDRQPSRGKGQTQLWELLCANSTGLTQFRGYIQIWRRATEGIKHLPKQTGRIDLSAAEEE